MESHQESSDRPFSLIAGQDFGFIMQQTHVPDQGHAIGRAKLNYFVNVANGNLVAIDHVISIPDIRNPVEFSYLYNSLESDLSSSMNL